MRLPAPVGSSRRLLGLVAAGLLVASTAGCDLSLFKKGRGSLFDYNTTGNVKFKTGRVDFPLVLKSKDSEPKLDILQVYARKDASPSFGFLLVNHELWGNFQVDVTVGNFDDRLPFPSSPGFACLELDGRGTSPLEFFSNCVQFHSGGAQVFAAVRGNSNLGTLALPGATAVDLRIETDGSNLWFMARESGMGEYDAYAWTPFSNQSFPLLPAVGGSNLQGGTGFSFAWPRLGFNGFPPSRESIEDVIADRLEDADEALWCACDALFFGDDLTAEEYMEDALFELEEADSLSSSLPDDRDTARLRKFIQKAAVGIEKSLDDLVDEKPVIRIQKGLTKHLDRTSGALGMIRPLGFNF